MLRFSDTYDDERIWWKNESGDWVFGYYADRVGELVTMEDKAWSTEFGKFYDAELDLLIHTCYQRGVNGEPLEGVRDLLADGPHRDTHRLGHSYVPVRWCV